MNAFVLSGYCLRTSRSRYEPQPFTSYLLASLITSESLRPSHYIFIRYLLRIEIQSNTIHLFGTQLRRKPSRKIPVFRFFFKFRQNCKGLEKKHTWEFKHFSANNNYTPLVCASNNI